MQSYTPTADKFIAAAKQYLNKPIKTVFELGARDCRESVQMSNLMPDAQIYAFECNPATLPLCRDNIKNHKNIHLIEKAVSNSIGEVTFYPTDAEKTVTVWEDGNPGASSLLKASGKYPLEQYVQNSITVSSTTLASEMAAHDIHEIDLIWMDIQGAELMALEGLEDQIANVNMIHMEVGFFEIYQGQPFFTDIKEYLNAKGFLLLKFTDFGTYSGDAIFINKWVLKNPIKNMTVTVADKMQYSLNNVQLKSQRPVRLMLKTASILARLLTGDCRVWKLSVGKVLSRLSIQRDPGNSSIPVDILLMVIPKDHATLPLVIQSIKENVRHPIGCITILGPGSDEIRSLAKLHGCAFQDETEQLPLTKADIAYTFDGINRSGWVFKQILVLNGEPLGTSEYFLVVDADTVLIKPHVFVKNGKDLLLYSDEYHLPYFGTYNRLLGEKHKSCVSFISHYMVFHRPKLKHLQLAIEKHTGMPWYKAIVENLDRTDASGFAEYETYGNFVYSHYSNDIWTEYWLNLSVNRSELELTNLLDSPPHGYRSMSLHVRNNSPQ